MLQLVSTMGFAGRAVSYAVTRFLEKQMGIRVSRFRAVVSRETKVNIGDTLCFIEDGDFLREFKECGLNEDDLECLQVAITAAPNDADVVPVSKNVRDLFYVVSADSTVTIRYAYLEPFNTILLLTAYEGDSVLPMTSEGAKIAEEYINRQLKYFADRSFSQGQTR